jgi:hypothetical protein
VKHLAAMKVKNKNKSKNKKMMIPTASNGRKIGKTQIETIWKKGIVV